MYQDSLKRKKYIQENTRTLQHKKWEEKINNKRKLARQREKGFQSYKKIIYQKKRDVYFIMYRDNFGGGGYVVQSVAGEKSIWEKGWLFVLFVLL